MEGRLVCLRRNLAQCLGGREGEVRIARHQGTAQGRHSQWVSNAAQSDRRFPSYIVRNRFVFECSYKCRHSSTTTNLAQSTSSSPKHKNVLFTFALSFFLRPRHCSLWLQDMRQRNDCRVIGNLTKGKKNGEEIEIFIYNNCDHAACYREVESQAISYTAGVPPVAAAILVAQGVWNPKTMVNVEELDPEPLINLLDTMGLPTKVEDRTRVPQPA